MDYQALALTLRLAAVTTVVLMLLAVPLAWWIARAGGWRGAVVQAIVALPLILPPTVIGFYLLVGLGPLTGVGRGISGVLGHPLAFTFSGLIVGSLVYSLPFAVQPMVAGFAAMDGGYLETAAGLGMSPARRFFRVALPLTRGSVLTSAVLTFTHTIGEFGVVLMVGGNIPGETRTLSIALYDQVSDGNYGAAAQTSLFLLVLSVLTLFAIYLRAAFERTRVPDGR